MSLRILEPGLFTLVVDQGRPHSRGLGVPVGGAADPTALALGNALLGNPPDAAALEISLAGPTLQAECDLACVVTGAPFELSCGLRSLRVGTTFTLHAGEVLRIRGTPEGMRGYWCVRGGIAAPLVLGSRTGLRPVQAGDVLLCSPSRCAGRFAVIDWHWDSGPPLPSGVRRLRVLAGAQADWFHAADIFGPTAETAPTFTVTPASNRMGLRLQGTPVRRPEVEMLSEPVCPGTVQATRDGQLIVLGVDGQTIGGYPKMAQVISADLDRIGQLRPGDRVVFQQVSLETAQQLYRRKRTELRQWLLRLRTAELPSGKHPAV